MARQVRPWLAQPAPDEALRVRVCDRDANQQNPSGTASSSRTRSPGLKFVGTFNRDDQELQFLSFGAVARFELQHPRIPASPSGRWTSAPQVELFGGLLAHTDAGKFWTGDCWSKCSMVRRQTIVQHGLGGAIVRGHAVQEERLVDEANASRSFSRAMPGLRSMPPLQIGAASVDSLWAELDVRFDIQLEGNCFL